MEIFTDAYERSTQILKKWQATGKLPALLSDIPFLFKQDGPDPSCVVALENLHEKLKKEIAIGLMDAKTKILAMCIEDEFGFQDRVALIKILMHFNFVARRGGQVIWVMDHPKDFERWIYDQLSNKNPPALMQEFQKCDEVFGADNRKMMADALMLARKWSADVEIKLATKSESILEVVRCWFHFDGDSELVVQKTADQLLKGFKKISNACNTNRIIFSDLPQLRSSFNKEGTVGAIAEGERLQTIYLFEAFLEFGRRDQFGNIPRLWLCALTILHELSHMLCDTVDIFYDYQGLRVRKGFSTADALNNAESWAYFAADVVEALPIASRKKALKI